jgi:NADH-quinone oxidoreductase subunit F
VNELENVLIKSSSELTSLRKKLTRKPTKQAIEVSVCVSTGCVARGALGVLEVLKEQLAAEGLEETITIKETGCQGFCEKGPKITLYPDDVSYFHVTPKDVPEIIESIQKKKIVKRLLYKDPSEGEKEKLSDIPFYKHQKRILLDKNEKIDPHNIEDYIKVGGYSALQKALFEMSDIEVIEEIKKSKLRGRGGGGFPTGIKWESTHASYGEPKYVVVNCDEGDPGAFMDRSLMEGDPYSVLEGLTIGAYAIGATEGYVYVRAEYPIAFKNINIAIENARRLGLLGKNILGSGLDFDVKVHTGAGAFVSGESSALMEAIEGRVGEPRPKYTHTSEKGIKGKPTCLNNVKTWANVPPIILNGAEWFKSIGTENSSGTKIFSLVGNVNNTGLIEVPMGITLNDLIYKIGGGVKNDKKFKAVQTGGPSGGLIPAQYLDLPVDFDSLQSVGSMMGSGGMVVMDEDTCMVDTAKYFVDFLLGESCGKCIPCREGLRVLSAILTDICEGRGKADDIQTIEDVLETMENASLCSLGTTAVNPVKSSLKYFKEEWDAHINEKRCPAKKCKALIDYYIDTEKCKACLLCTNNCPSEAIMGGKGNIQYVVQDNCIKCGTCYDICPFDAVSKLSGEPIPSQSKKGGD